MHPRVRAVLLASAALVALVPSGRAAALAAHSGAASSRAAVGQSLTWAIVPSANRSGTNNELSGVSCISASQCIAVGSSSRRDVAVTDKTLVESWNGTAWSVTPSPDEGSNGDYLWGVSCTAADACAAIGHYGPELLSFAESWNGSTWSTVPLPNVPGDQSSSLNSISCAAADACVAVGGAGATLSGPGSTLTESWDGSTWSIVPSPNTGGAQADNFLSGASCASSAMCMAVGGDSGPRQKGKTLTELGTSSG